MNTQFWRVGLALVAAATVGGTVLLVHEALVNMIDITTGAL